MGAYGEMQGDVLSTELARQFSESGKLGIAELLLKQWERQDALEFPAESDEPDTDIDRGLRTHTTNPFMET
jgi:Rod binding domain-containing protein